MVFAFHILCCWISFVQSLAIAKCVQPYLLPHAPQNIFFLYSHLSCFFFLNPLSPINTACWSVGQPHCLDLVQVTRDSVNSWIQWPYHVQKTTFHNSPPRLLALPFFLPSILRCSLNLGWRLGQLLLYSYGLGIVYEPLPSLCCIPCSCVPKQT